MNNQTGIVQVSIVPNYDNENIITGRWKPPLFVSTRQESVNMLIDCKDRIRAADNPWNFVVDLKSNIFRAKSLSVQKVIIPKINNITIFNNEIKIKHELGTTASFTIQPALYNTSSLANELTQKTNAAFVAAGIADSVTTAFDSITKTFYMESVNSKKFFFDEECSFISKGIWCCNFSGEPLANVPTTTKVYSGRSCLLYTRYITFHSAALCVWSLGDSRTSDALQGGDIICIVDLCSIYDNLDFDVSTPFGGAFKAVLTPEAAFLNIANSQKNFNDLVDIYCKSEWGDNMNDVCELGSPYPENIIGPSLWLEIFF